ncbi:MAG: DUF1902 domain-containing protein [Rhizomicrobium sp.]
MSRFDILCHWDAEAGVYVAHSDAIPGLSTEAETVDRLMQRAAAVAPELIALNKVAVDSEGAELHFIIERSVPANLAA